MLATIAIVVYTKYDLNRFRRELAEDTIAIESNAPQQTQQDESEDDIPLLTLWKPSPQTIL